MTTSGTKSVLVTGAASMCVFRGDTVLLVKRGKQPLAGTWSLPGGSIKPGETANAAALREVAEETGIHCLACSFTGIDDMIVRASDGTLTHHYLIAVFAGLAPQAAAPVAGDDASDAQFVPLASLQALGLTPTLMARVAAARAAVIPQSD